MQLKSGNEPADKIIDQSVIVVKRPFSGHTDHDCRHRPGNQYDGAQETPPFKFHIQDQCQPDSEYDMEKHGDHHKYPGKFQGCDYFLILKYIEIIGNSGKLMNAAQNPDIVKAVDHRF